MEAPPHERLEALRRAARFLGASLPLGSLAGIRLKLHWSFAVVALVLAGWTASSASEPGGVLSVVGWGFVQGAILYAFVLLHEFAHAGMAAARGRTPREIVLTPLGGTAIIDGAMANPLMELEVALAGPVVNLLAVGFGVALNASQGHLPKAWGTPWSLSAAVGFAFWANVWLAVFNLLPAFPLDGGRVVRAIASWRLGERTGTRIAARTGELAAIAMGGVGIWWGGGPALVLIGIGVSNLLACETAIRLLELGCGVYDEPVLARDAHHGPAQGPEEEEELERQVDELLAKIAKGGLSSLTFRERRFLRRASRRYRESLPR